MRTKTGIIVLLQSVLLTGAIGMSIYSHGLEEKLGIVRAELSREKLNGEVKTLLIKELEINRVKAEETNAKLTKDYQLLQQELKKEKAKKKAVPVVSRSVAKPVSKKSFYVTATAYTQRAEEGTADGITKTETRVTEGRTVAVDPDMIPLGSKLYLDFPSVKGYYIAEDIGGAIKSNRIDIYMNSLTDARNFGRQKGTVTIIE
jgi:3D (Asp-Asp-Asp) domain-containing protein